MLPIVGESHVTVAVQGSLSPLFSGNEVYISPCQQQEPLPCYEVTVQNKRVQCSVVKITSSAQAFPAEALLPISMHPNLFHQRRNDYLPCTTLHRN